MLRVNHILAYSCLTFNLQPQPSSPPPPSSSPSGLRSSLPRFTRSAPPRSHILSRSSDFGLRPSFGFRSSVFGLAPRQSEIHLLFESIHLRHLHHHLVSQPNDATAPASNQMIPRRVE